MSSSFFREGAGVAIMKPNGPFVFFSGQDKDEVIAEMSFYYTYPLYGDKPSTNLGHRFESEFVCEVRELVCSTYKQTIKPICQWKSFHYPVSALTVSSNI